MKIKNIVKSSVLGLALIGSSAIANDDSFFVGVEVGNTKYNAKVSSGVATLSED